MENNVSEPVPGKNITKYPASEPVPGENKTENTVSEPVPGENITTLSENCYLANIQFTVNKLEHDNNIHNGDN